MTEMPLGSFGRLLRQLRTGAGLTQEQLAELAQVSARSVSDLERGINQAPRRETARLIADALDLTGESRAAFESAARGRPAVSSAASRVTGPMVSHPAIPMVSHPATLGRQPVSLAPRLSMLAGREELLSALHARVVDVTAGPRIVVLHGLGGAGKTSVAVEYAHRQLASMCLVWQFPAGDPAVLAADFARLAAQLGLGGLDRRDPVAAVHAVLAASASPWLLIFDNAPGINALQGVLPPAGPGTVLVTSQNALAPPAHAMEVGLLSPDAAAEFLSARTGDRDERAARDLAEQLAGLPLALEQAAAYIHDTGGSLADYLTAFRERRAALLPRGEPTGYAGTLATTWELAFTRVSEDAPSAAGLLKLLACFAAEPVPLRLLLDSPHAAELTSKIGGEVGELLGPLAADPLAISDAIAALRRHSLISIAGSRVILMHRLVQAVTLSQMPADVAATWRATAAALIDAALPESPYLPETWQACAVLLPHARTVLSDESRGMAQIATYLGHSGGYAAARDMQRRIVDARTQSLGPGHPGTLAARHNLAHWTGAAGDPAAARNMLADLLPIRERLLGREHPDTMTTRANLARRTGQAGDAVAARDMLADLLPIRERVLGPEDTITLATRANLATWTGRAGDPAAARDMLAALLPVRERVSGSRHPETLHVRHNLASWTGEAGDPAAARDMFTVVVSVREDVLGPEHPHTLNARDNLARWTGQAGNPDQAREIYVKLLPIMEKVLGPDHPSTLAALGRLQNWINGSDKESCLFA